VDADGTLYVLVPDMSEFKVTVMDVTGSHHGREKHKRRGVACGVPPFRKWYLPHGVERQGKTVEIKNHTLLAVNGMEKETLNISL
jgi:hypothetical protein